MPFNKWSRYRCGGASSGGVTIWRSRLIKAESLQSGGAVVGSAVQLLAEPLPLWRCRIKLVAAPLQSSEGVTI